MTDPIIKTDKLTPKPDKRGVTVQICDPGWFEKNRIYKIANAPARTVDLEFSGADLNFVARVLYAESSGSANTSDAAKRSQEKQAILNVKHFRLNRQGYPNRVKAKTFTEVCEAPGQFESVYASSPKFSKSAADTFESLKKPECSDLAEAIEAVRYFIEHGPDQALIFDNFRGGKGSRGQTIALSRFWLSPEGEKLRAKEE